MNAPGCQWCGEAPWAFSCAMCDPRTVKRMCGGCMLLWHSRGYSREHLVTNRVGQALSYRAWASMNVLPELPKEDETTTGAEPNTVTTTASARANGAPGAAPGTPTQPQSGSVPEETKQDETMEDNSVDVEFGEPQMTDEEVVEVVDVAEEKRSRDQVTEDKATKSCEEKKAAATSVRHTESSVSTIPQMNWTKEGASRKDNCISARKPSLDQEGPSTTATAESTPDKETALSQPQSALANLEKLLRWFPTKDRALLEMLAKRIETALMFEDEIMCAKIRKCKEPECRSTLKHYEHCKAGQVCGDPKCAEIAAVYRHRRGCQMKEKGTPSSGGEKPFVCPFCIRIYQRRSLGTIVAMDHVISKQRQLLRDPHSAQSEATRNFCLQMIGTSTDRKQLKRAEVESLNALARESNAPIFNFPPYNWHFGDAVPIKREPTPVIVTEVTATAHQEAPPANSNTFAPADDDIVGASPSTQEEDGPDDTNADSSETHCESAPGKPKFNGNFINNLLRDKNNSGPHQQPAQQRFDKAMNLAYAIVDASFCAPSKAQKCLLNCKSILVHLQHHLDVQVCNEHMCTSVEHHFAHLSQCKSRGESSSCEYCLRVQEREFARAVDMMEADQPEAEARVQSIINAITTSFTNDPPEEREQTVLQLEDELDQAEDDKRDLADKLNTARSNLRRVSNSLESRGMPSGGNPRLPTHFMKIKQADGGTVKKRRVD